jgi:hypothetical protein
MVLPLYYLKRSLLYKYLVYLFAPQPKTLELLRDRALKNPDEQLRAWAQD